MQYEVKTKQGNNFIVDDNEISLWLEVEEMFDITFHEAQEKLSRQSISTVTKLFFAAAKLGNHTQLKTYKVWVRDEFESFDLVGETDPKVEKEHLEEI